MSRMRSLWRVTLQLQLGSALVCGSLALQQFGYGSEQEADAIFESAQEAPSANAVDTALGKRFADAAWYGRLGYSAGQCYAYVWSALRKVKGSQIESLPVPARSAYMFGDWVDNNPISAKKSLSLVRAKGSGRSAPEGSVLVWEPGQCGYNSIHGHIEIALGDGTACSDFCGPIARGCGEPRIYVPSR
jgi:hypothetical protein